MRNQWDAFTNWVNNCTPAEEQNLILEKEQFYDKLKSFQLVSTSGIVNSIGDAISDFVSYTKKYTAENAELTNFAQHSLLADNETLLHDFHTIKKELEKNYRDYEKLFKLAEDHLKNRDDSGKNGSGKAWKALDKPKEIRLLLDKLNEYSSPVKNNTYEEEEKSPLYFLKMAEWLQQRFPKAEYEDVTGLCKLAAIADLEEQDYSLNPGRYVGVVIEEDGMTEEEFETEIQRLNTELNVLNASALELERLINRNILNLFGNE
jgi:type I restriction enzyme M protein